MEIVQNPQNIELPNGHCKQSSQLILAKLSDQINSCFSSLSERELAMLTSLQIKVDRFDFLTNKLQQTIKALKSENTALKQALANSNAPKKEGAAEDQAEDYNEFKSVYESFKCHKCSEVSKKYQEIVSLNSAFFKRQSEMIEAITAVRAGLSQNEQNIEGVWRQLKKTRDSAGMVFEQNKVLKEALTKMRKDDAINKASSLQLICIDHAADKHKHKIIADKIKTLHNSVVEFSDQPISDADLIELNNSLLAVHGADCIKEVTITNAYAVHMEGLASLLRQNSGVLKKLIINNTLLNVHSAIKILETLNEEKMELDELNLDENKLVDEDLTLMIKPFIECKIKSFSVKRNELRTKSIEKFCKITAHMKILEKIDVGKVRISEQKELEWKTDFKKLEFERIIVNEIDYQYL